MLQPLHLSDDLKERSKYAIDEGNVECGMVRGTGLLYAAMNIYLVGTFIFKGASESRRRCSMFEGYLRPIHVAVKTAGGSLT